MRDLGVSPMEPWCLAASNRFAACVCCTFIAAYTFVDDQPNAKARSASFRQVYALMVPHIYSDNTRHPAVFTTDVNVLGALLKHLQESFDTLYSWKKVWTSTAYSAQQY